MSDLEAEARQRAHDNSWAAVDDHVDALDEEIAEMHRLLKATAIVLARRDEQIARLRAALKRYGQHQNFCDHDVMQFRDMDYPKRRCTCGFEAAQQGQESQDDG